MGCINRRLKFLNFLVVLSVVLLNSLVHGFNLDAFNYAVYGTSQEYSMFGFTVAVHKQGQNRGWILVGAPEAQSRYQGDQVRLGGVVYKCRPNSDDPCEEIPFDRDGNQVFGNKEIDQKSGQWFGATLTASGSSKGGPVVACAPRYVWYSKEMNRRDPVGTCFVSDSSFEKFEEYSPCRTSNWGYDKHGYCQAGFSAAINSIGDRLFVGAPGSYYWQGQMYSIDAHARFNYTPGLLGMSYGDKGSVNQLSLETRPAVFQTREGRAQDDDSYLGYSTVIGDFLNNGEQGVAVGMPRGADLHGKILFFTWNLTNYKNISGNQLGSYFGYSLAAADVDGDKKLDLIVGAPMNTEVNTQGKYDVGRVYVFYQGGGYTSFDKSSYLDGVNSKSRFGHSVAYLGDLNWDGYDDFAVGAPYDGKNNQGAVYIYYGSAKGVIEKYGQVIYAEDVAVGNGIPVSTFGFSIAGGLDMDGNEYPDMAVGAYLSNAAFFFRSRPVVRVEAYVQFTTANKLIDLQTKACNLRNSQVACTDIMFCIKYTGKGIPQQIQLNVHYLLDVKKPNEPRMAFLREDTHSLNRTIVLYKGEKISCQTEKIYIKNDIRDKLTQLDADFTYSMVDEERGAHLYGRTRNPQSQLKPVLDLNLHGAKKDSISIQNNCGSDKICVPNLHVNITTNVEEYYLNSSTNLEFDITVSNFGEDSFETTLYLTTPEGVYYKKSEAYKDMQGGICRSGENRTLICDVGNPLPINRIAKFRLIFETSLEESMPQSYEFDVNVNSSNPEDRSTLLDNHQHISVRIKVDSALDVSGRSFPQDLYLPNTTQYTSGTIFKESDIGPQVIHVYTVKNRGPFAVHEAEMYFVWPWQTLAGEDLLYLLDQPHVPDGVKCDAPALVNYKNYLVEPNPQSIWERLQMNSSRHQETAESSSVTIESGQSVTAVASGTLKTNSRKHEENVSSSPGDTSAFYEARYNSSQTGTSENTQGGWAGASGQNSDGHINMAGQSVTTHSEWRETEVNGERVKVWTNVTTVKDASGKILNTFYSTNENSDQVSSGTNIDSFGQNIGGYKQRPKVIYSSSGNAGLTTGEENLSISGGVLDGERQGSSVEEHQHQQKTISGSTQQNVYGSQQSHGELGGVNEKKHYEEHAYTVGAEGQEGVGQVGTTAIYEDDQIIRHQESHSSHGGQTTNQGSASGAAVSEVDQAYENRRRYEERQRYEERLRLYEEQRRKLQQQQQTGQNVVGTSDEERTKYEQRLHKDEEERRRHQEQLRRLEQQRIAEAKARQEAYDLQIRRQEEERRRQQTILDEQRRRQQQQQQPTEEERRRQQEEIRRRQEEEQQRQEQERRRQHEIEERRRYEEQERIRQWNQQQSGAGSSIQQSGSRDRTYYGGARVRTGYFDAQGRYHNESSTLGDPGGSGVVYNHTWTVEGTATRDDADRNRGGQMDFGQAGAAGGNQFRTQTIDLGMDSIGGGGAGSFRGQDQEVSGERQWVNSGQRTRGGTFSGTLEGGVSGDQYSSEWQRNHWEDEPVPPQTYNEVERDNVLTDRPDLSRHRGKRQVPIIDPYINDHLKCTATRCFYVKCVVGMLKKDDFVSIAFRSRLNVRAVKHLTSAQQPLKLSSIMVARISELPFIGKPEGQELYTHEIFTDIPAGEPELTPQVVPLWIILLSAIAGTLILLLVILLLYKCGFFKRKRPSSAPERQPLRTNGYHGD